MVGRTFLSAFSSRRVRCANLLPPLHDKNYNMLMKRIAPMLRCFKPLSFLILLSLSLCFLILAFWADKATSAPVASTDMATIASSR